MSEVKSACIPIVFCTYAKICVPQMQVFIWDFVRWERKYMTLKSFCTQNAEKWLVFGVTFTAIIGRVNKVNWKEEKKKFISILECMYAVTRWADDFLCTLGDECVCVCVCRLSTSTNACRSGNIINITFHAFALRSTANNNNKPSFVEAPPIVVRPSTITKLLSTYLLTIAAAQMQPHSTILFLIKRDYPLTCRIFTQTLRESLLRFYATKVQPFKFKAGSKRHSFFSSSFKKLRTWYNACLQCALAASWNVIQTHLGTFEAKVKIHFMRQLNANSFIN